MYSIHVTDDKGNNEVMLNDTMLLETLRVNGDTVITFDIGYTDNNKYIFENIDKRWIITVRDGTNVKKYIVQNIYEKSEGDSVFLSVDTLLDAHDTLKREMVYEQYSGSKTRDEWFRWLFNGSSIKLDIRASSQYALSIESFGMDSRLSLFYQLLDKFDLEYFFGGSRYDSVIVVDRIGVNKSDYISYGVNLNHIERTRNMSGFGTYGEIYGAYIDENNHDLGRYKESYTSPLASRYGKIPIKPISDERFKVKEHMIREIRSAVERSIVQSLDVNFNELSFEKDGGWVGAGDYIMLIDERLGIKMWIRVLQIDTTYNHFGDIINIEYTLGDYDEYYKSQLDLLNEPKELNDKINGKFSQTIGKVEDMNKGLESQIKDANDKIDGVDKNLGNLGETVDGLDGNIKDVDNKVTEVENSIGNIKDELNKVSDKANGAGKIYRQKDRPMGADIQQGDLWYQPVYNSALQREEVTMYQYQRDGGIGKWVEVIDVQLGDADNLTRGEINAKVINLINLNADEIVTGSIRGKNLKINLDTGSVEFQKGVIYKSDNSFIIDIDNGYITNKDPNRSAYFLIKDGGVKFYDRSIIDPNVNPIEYGSLKSDRETYNYGHNKDGEIVVIEGKNGVTLQTPDFDRDLYYDTRLTWPSATDTYKKLTGNFIHVDGGEDWESYNKGNVQLHSSGETHITSGSYTGFDPHSTLDARAGLHLNTFEGTGSGSTHVSLVANHYFRTGETVTSKYHSHLNLRGQGASALKAGGTLQIHAGGTISINGTSTTVYNNFSVTGKKNAIHVTRDGVRETPAYEMATSYIGDMGEVVTSPSGIAIVEIPDIFYDIANFDEEYQVFLTPYDFCQFKVSVRENTYFIIETDKGNCRIGYEVKAKRRGYESEWFHRTDMDNDDIKNGFTDLQIEEDEQ